MAYKRTSPQPVVEGGTGTQTNTLHGVLLGEGSNPIGATTAGTAGQVLQSGGALADPSYSSTTYPVTSAQGDLIYGSALNTLSTLNKNTTATRYLANTGTSNNPNWDQVNLTNGVTGTLPIANGGTNASSFATTDGTIYYDGTSLVTTATGTSGQLLTSAGAGVAPSYQTIGTNSGLTTHGVVIAEGNSAFSATSAGTNGQVLIGATGNDPAFATLTSTGSTLTYTAGANSLNIDVTAPLTVANGGTGNTSFTVYAPVCGGTTATGALQSASSGISNVGYVLTSTGASSLPTWQAAAGGSSVSFSAYLNGTVSNYTGDGTTGLNIPYNAVSFNNGSGFDTVTGIFTAPSSGLYYFVATLYLLNLGAGHTSLTANFGAPVSLSELDLNPFAMSNGGGLQLSFSNFVSLATNDQVTVNCVVSGSTKTVGLNGAFVINLNMFAGFKVA